MKITVKIHNKTVKNKGLSPKNASTGEPVFLVFKIYE